MQQIPHQAWNDVGFKRFYSKLRICRKSTNYNTMSFLQKIIQRFFTSSEPDPLKYLIVGLGNMGAEYDDTRHNAGFLVVDKLAQEFEVSFKDSRLGFTTEFKHKGRTFCLLKPTTYMNLSGKAVLYWLQKHNIKPDNLLVVVDDLNLEFGTLRLRGKGSDGGHNGLKDINKILGTNKYARLRFGIGDNFRKGQQVDYVLGKWSDEENDKLPDLLKRATEMSKSFGAIGLQFTMNQFNK